MSMLSANSVTSQLFIYQNDDAIASQSLINLGQLAHKLSGKTRKND